MADQRITELVELTQVGTASNDVLPIADISASQTKKIQVKSLIQAGFNLADASTLDISKINQGSTAKLGTSAFANDAVTYAKIQNVSATDRLLGRSSSGAGDVEEIVCTAFARTILDDANASTARSTLGLGAVATGDTINTSLLENDSVTNAKIASGAVDTTELANDSVTSAKIDTGAVDTTALASGSVTLAKMAANSVSTTQVVDSGITQSKLASSAVATINIADSGVTQSKLAADAVATVNIADSGVTQSKLATDAVATVNIVDSGITQSKLASDAVATVNITDANVTLAKMASNSVGTSQLVDSGITQSKLASGSVDTVNLVDSGVTQPKLAANAVDTINVAALAITNAKIANSTIEASKLNLASGSIDGAVISGSSIPSGVFASGVIVDSDIADNTVTFSKLQEVATDVLVGRSTAGSGSLETITLTSAGRALLDDASAAAQRTTLGLGTIATRNTIASGDFDAGAIVASDIGDGQVTTAKIADSGVTSVKIADDAVITSKIADANVTQAKMASGSVNTAQLVDSGVTQVKLASDAVDTVNIADSAVVNAKIANSTISAEKLNLASGSIDGSVISGSTILSGSFASGVVDTEDIADNAVTFGKMQQVSSDVLVGRATAGSGDLEAITLTSAGRALLDDANASAQRTTLGLGSIATQNASGVAITGGTAILSSGTLSYATINGGVITGITDLAIADGGTGASTASGARANLGLAIGSDVQAYDAGLQSIAGLTTASGQIIYTTGSDTYATSTITAAGRALIDDASATAQRATLGLGSLAIQNTVASGDYDAGSIATADIADSAITTAKIVNSGITTAKIVDSNITTAKINDSAVTTAKIADSGVTTVKIASGAVTLAKITPATQSNIILGRATASGGVLEEIACTAAARSILDDVSVEDIRETLGLGTLATQNGTLSGTSTGNNTGDQTITLTGDVTGNGTGTFAATIANNAVTTAKINAGAVTTSKIVDSGVTALKLAGQSTVIVTNSTPAGSGTYIGQQWLNTSTSYEYTWDGSSWLRQAALNTVTVSGDSVYSFSTTYPDSFSAIISPSLNVQSANAVFVGPASGSDAAPTFRALVGSDLPIATSGTTGVMRPGAGLVMNGDQIDHSNSIASGTFYKVVVDGQGHVSSGATALVAADIPVLSASKISAGTFGSGFIADNSINGEKLADYSVTKFGETTPSAQFTGQFFFNPLEKDLFLWDGNVWNPVGISIGEIVFAGTYNASGNTVATVSAEGSAAGLTIGQPLPSPSATFNRYYVVVESGGTGTSPAPETELNPPDLLLCNGTAWVEIDVSSTYTSQTATQIGFTPAANVSSTNVQAAIEEVSTECRNANNIASGVLDESYGGTGQSSYTKGDLIAASGTTDLGLVSVGSDGQVLTADSTEDTGLTWTTPSSGTVLSVTVGAPMSVTSGTTTPSITISGATTAGSGVVRLTDSTSTTSSTLAATATAVKTAYDLANAALPKAGGVVTGTVTFGTTGVLAFEGASDDDYEITLASANATADRVVTLPDTTGTVVTTGDSGTVTNTMLAGSIADTKLNTISTAGKIDNSATTATSANTASAIVARDGSGDFSAGTISATIDEGSF